MAKLYIVFVFICVLQFNICCGGRIPRAVNSEKNEKISKEFRLSLDQVEKIEAVAEEYKDLNETLVAHMITLARICPIIAPEETYSESINLVVLSPVHLEKFIALDRVVENKPTEEKMESCKVVCAYLNRSIFTENISLTEVISIEQFREFTALADKADAQNLTGNIRAASDRKLCQVVNSAEIFATSAPETPADLSTEQLEAYERVHENYRNASIFDWFSKFREVCDFLNETVSPLDQSEKLNISVKLYEKLVAVRKLHSNKTDAGRVALARQFCETINSASAGSDDVSLIERESPLNLSADKLQLFNELWTSANAAPNSEKISKITDVCSLVETLK